MNTRDILFRSASLAVLATGLVWSAAAQDAEAPAPEASDDEGEPILRAEKIVVQGEIGYRNRSEETVPTLQYGEDYFQRFEPLTAGDALKRVPSVTFLSDVIESDGARLRGLAPGYTQILINGEKVPGSNADRSFFMDRIPAELIDRVEIVRSSSARRSGDALAGTLNIVLRDGYELDGGYVRAGALYFDDGELKPSFGGVYGGEVGPGRILLGANVQGRYNPKLKDSIRFEDLDDDERPPNSYSVTRRGQDLWFANREDQTDTRDGTDYSFNVDYAIDEDDYEFQIGGFAVYTDREETERSFEYRDPRLTAGATPLPDGGDFDTEYSGLLTDNSNVNGIEQTNYAVRSSYERDWSLGDTEFRVGFASFEDEQWEYEAEFDFEDFVADGDPAVLEGEYQNLSIVDEELSFEINHEFDLSDGIEMEFGVFWQQKDRETDIDVAEDEAEIDSFSSYDQFSQRPEDFELSYDEFEPIPGGLSTIEENRLDVFALLEGESGSFAWEAGVRYETTDVDIVDMTADDEFQNTSNDYDIFLPSAHVKYDVTNADRFTASVARTVRRPNFDRLSPAFLDGEYGDNDFIGNPFLKPETAWGIDVGYERRLGAAGVFGVNVFYRDITDLIELQNTLEPSEEALDSFDEDVEEFLEDNPGATPDDPDYPVFEPDSFVYTAGNTGDGYVYGIEFDLSTPLTVIGLDNTGLFANLSLLDSEVTDFAGDRRFNGQSDYVYNFGFIQDLPALNAAFGATYRKQGDAFFRVEAEEVQTSYGADLEIFVEKSIGDSFTVRFVGSNLLNASKDEIFDKFDNVGDQFDLSYDEYELETEEAGPVFQIMARLAF